MNQPIVLSRWSDLLPELLDLIAKKLGNYVDYVHFRAVCPSWRTSLPNKPHHLLTQLPWLLLPHFNNNNNNASDTHCSFFNLADNKSYTLELPEVIGDGKRCWGSPHGWLIIQEKQSMFCLLNPLTRSKIQLPSSVLVHSPITLENHNTFSTWDFSACLCDIHVMKAVLFANPSLCSDFVVMIIMTKGPGSLAFYQFGAEVWTLIPEAKKIVFHDIVCFEGKFYFVDEEGYVYVCNLGSSPNLVRIADPPESVEDDDPHEKYLVESVRGLLLVYRYHVDFEDIPTDGTSRNSTYYFTFHKLDLNELKWTEIDDMGEEVFFLGTNYSFSLSGREYPSCRKNSVYYTDEKRDTSGRIQGHDVGVFTIDEGDVQPLPDSPVPVPYKTKYMLPPPVWVTLSP